MRARKGLIAVVKTVRAVAKQPLRRKYWVRTKTAIKKISPLRARAWINLAQRAAAARVEWARGSTWPQ